MVSRRKTGQSTFFTDRRSADAEDLESSDRKPRAPARNSSTLPPNLALSSPDPLNAYKEDDLEPLSRPGSAADDTTNPYHTADNSLYLTSSHHDYQKQQQDITAREESFKIIHENLNSILHHLVLLDRKHDRLEDDVRKDIKVYSEGLEQERFKTTKLEEILNEAIELQQAEISALKEQNLMATRVDYQHNDRFRTIEENMESLQNHMVRIENALMDVRQVRLTSNVWQRVALTAGNIVVEFLKIALFVVASVLDMVRPLTGSRNRSAVAFALMFFALFFGHHLTKLNIFGGSSSEPGNSGSK
ncbi:unnamed protein product [Caenorhabditis sp. 36 PRJEB53466]|nr:unnamed protein product [Caenorhabditis sp. 36 PRJEB53466]